MTEILVQNLLFYALLILWLAAVTRTILGSLTLWQIKEYRLDRFRAHLETREGLRQLFNGAGPARAVAGLLLAPMFALLDARSLLGLLALYYLAEAVYTAGLLIKRRLKRPDFTGRALLIAAFSMATALGFVFWAGDQLGLAVFLVAHGLAWLITTLWIFISQPLINALKEKARQQAVVHRVSLKKLTVVGITGSYGKTSTKTFLTQILQANKVNVVASPGNTNTEIGLAHFLTHNVQPRHKVFVAEVGAYRLGEIRRVTEFLKPQIGIVTAINDQHVALFGSRANIIKAKYELIEALPREGLAIFNDDDEACRTMANNTSHVKVMRYSASHRADVWAENIRSGQQNLTFTLRAGREAQAVTADVIGSHLTSTLLAASSAALALGLTLEEISKGARQVEVPAATMEIKPGFKGSIVIDDSYSANPDGVAAALSMLAEYPARKRFLVMRPMIELGRYGAAAHRALGEQIAQSCDFAFFINRDFEAEIREGAAKQGLTPEKLIFSASPTKLAVLINDFVSAGDVILLENRIPEALKRLIM